MLNLKRAKVSSLESYWLRPNLQILFWNYQFFVHCLLPRICSCCWKLQKCIDANSTTCHPGNLSFSVSCIPGFTAGFVYFNDFYSNGGVCLPCGSNCLQCDAKGSGKCDTGKCAVGFVMLTNTVNCTACIGGCSKCNPDDPTQCLTCLDGQYFDGTKTCQPCVSYCATCSAETTCLSCPKGYGMVATACMPNPDYCISLTGPTSCSACFVGYILSNDQSSCVLDTSCIGEGSCVLSCWFLPE